jgi:hypothetical protein
MSGPGETLGAVNPGEVNPWRGAWNEGGYGVGGPYNGAYYGATTVAPTGPLGTMGTVNPGSVNPWRGAWNLNADWNSVGFWAPVDAAAGAVGALAGAATTPFNACYQFEPRYDTFGHYLGQERVNTCS